MRAEHDIAGLVVPEGTASPAICVCRSCFAVTAAGSLPREFIRSGAVRNHNFTTQICGA